MSKKHSPAPILAERYPLALLAGLIDITLVIGAAYVAYHQRFGFWSMNDRYAVATLALALMGTICQLGMDTYGSWRGRPFLRQLSRVYTGWLLAFALLLGIAVAAKVTGQYSRIWLSTTALYALIAVTLFRLSTYLLLRFARSQGRNQKHVLVVEGHIPSDEISKHLPDLGRVGYEVRQRLTLENHQQWFEQLITTVSEQNVHEVWLCLPLQEGESIKKILHSLRHLTVEVRFIPDLGDLPLLNHRVSQIAGLYALDISLSPMEGSARLVKRLEDLIIGSIISILILPVCLAIAIAIKMTSTGPIIFKQYRTGINGRRFKVYKFRSMEVHTEVAGHVTQAKFGDPRVTRLGAFLRKTSLDELPQFYNVLQGRMSIVGPRPHALAHNEHYKDLVESYMKRHKVKPGITGWAQVNGYRGETDTIEKMQRRVEYDLWYINNWSLWLDLKIIFLTVFKGFVNNKP
ncbi:undecaprenyl-phosphate glucose phosphotransferase [Alcaligenaceae bacterium 429]|nr:undecaprenyl-phosphate glucose phosphotransferase [Alcaligenaceae bacterium 429]